MYRYLPIISLVFLFLSVNLTNGVAQVNENDPWFSSLSGFSVNGITNCGDLGFVVDEGSSRPIPKQKVKKVVFNKYNSSKEFVDSVSVLIEKGFLRSFNGVSEGHSHLVFKHSYSKRFLILSLELEEMSIKKTEVKFKDYVVGNGGIISEDMVFLMNSHKGQELISINWLTGEKQREDIEVPNLKNKYLVPFDFKKLSSGEFLLFTRSKRGGDTGSHIIKYTEHGQYISCWSLPTKRVVSHSIIEYPDGDILIWGSYTDKLALYEAGYYSIYGNKSNVSSVNMLDFWLLDNFISDKKGKYPNGTHIEERSLKKLPDQSFVLTSEVFYMMNHKAPNGNLIYDGDAFTHVVTLKLDKRGNFLWNATYGIGKLKKGNKTMYGGSKIIQFSDESITVGNTSYNVTYDCENGSILSENDELEIEE